MTMGPGGGSDPGNAGRGGGSSAGRGASGGGGFGRDTPGSPNAADGRRGSTMGRDGGLADGRGATGGGGLNDTPGAPGNPGRRGQNAAGSTAASRARDAMSRHQRERDIRSIENGGGSLLDNDSQYGAGLSLTESVDRQNTEHGLNRAGVTDTLGMSEVDRLGTAKRNNVPLSQMEQKTERGIRHGFTSQTMANRVSDITGIPSAATGLISSMMGRPKNTMKADVELGRERANDHNLGALAAPVSAALNHAGVSVPGNVVSFGYGMGRAALDENMNALMDSPEAGTAETNQVPGSLASGNGTKASTAIAAMSRSPGMTASRPPGRAFGWSPVDIGRYRRNPMNLASNS